MAVLLTRECTTEEDIVTRRCYDRNSEPTGGVRSANFKVDGEERDV